MLKSNAKKKNKRETIYMDYASSASPNPSSIHREGIIAKKNLESARKITAGILNARTEEIIFTNGGTESNNIAIQGAVWAWHENKKQISGKELPHIITTNIEHPSVLETVKMLAKRGLAQFSIVAVEADGIVDPKKIKKEFKKNTVLVSVIYANNEIGTIQPISEIAKEIRHFRKFHSRNFREFNQEVLPFFHTDAVQAVNYLNLNVEKLGVDLLSLSGSKLVDSGRVGVLFKRKSMKLAGILAGGDQEFGLRPGTENLPAILKFTEALVSVSEKREKESKRLTELRDYLLEGLVKISKNVLSNNMVINGSMRERLPNNLNITIPGIPSDLLVIELSAKGIMVSEKSACKSNDKKASHVIEALRSAQKDKLGKKKSQESLRFSLGYDTTKADIDYTLDEILIILKKLKKWYLG